MKNRFLSLILILCVLASSVLSGCGKGDDSFTMYYIDQSGMSLTSDSITLTGSVDEQVNRVCTTLEKYAKKSNIAYLSYESSYVDGQIAYIYYNQTDKNADEAVMVLYRAALVKTVTQLKEVNYVAMYVNGAPATHQDGTVLGLLNAGDFVDEANDSGVDLQWTDLKLYYANAKGDKLVPVTVSVAYNKNVPMERVVMDQLISGTNLSGCYRTLPANTKVLAISVREGTCYVNFDSTFLNELVNVSAATVIYSVVNSLCELGNIQKVQILVNGDSSKMYRETIPLSTVYTANPEIVQQVSSESSKASSSN